MLIQILFSMMKQRQRFLKVKFQIPKNNRKFFFTKLKFRKFPSRNFENLGIFSNFFQEQEKFVKIVANITWKDMQSV